MSDAPTELIAQLPCLDPRYRLGKHIGRLLRQVVPSILDDEMLVPAREVGGVFGCAARSNTVGGTVQCHGRHRDVGLSGQSPLDLLQGRIPCDKPETNDDRGSTRHVRAHCGNNIDTRAPRPHMQRDRPSRIRRGRLSQYLVGGLAVELEVEFGFRAPISPLRERFQLFSPQRTLREGSPPDSNANSRCLSGNARLPCNRLGRRDNTPGNQALPPVVLTRKQEDRIALSDVLPPVHRLFRREDECRRPRIANLSLDYDVTPDGLLIAHLDIPCGVRNGTTPRSKDITSSVIIRTIAHPVILRAGYSRSCASERHPVRGPLITWGPPRAVRRKLTSTSEVAQVLASTNA